MKITRKCLEGRFFLTPDQDQGDEIREFVGYCLAYVARECEVLVHTCVVMSNHIHMDITDPKGNIATFKQRFFSLVARGVNRIRGRSDSFWSGDEGCVTIRPDAEQTLRDMVYTLCNPVQDGLVKRGELWPGFTTHGWRFGETRTFRRPNRLFDPNGDMPQCVALTLARPPLWLETTDDDLFAALMDVVSSHEARIRDERRRANERFAGPNKIRRQRWTRTGSAKVEPSRPKPTVATADRRLRCEELQREAAWRGEYAQARAQLLAGVDVVFPYGTYWLPRFAGVAVAGRSPP